jgi:Zn-dependent protease
MDPLQKLAEVLPAYIIFLFSLCFHEFAHGWVAQKRGDPTAKMMGRLTLNPMAHADIFGTVIFPLMGMFTGWPFLFGWAKPVPVNDRNFANPRTDMFWVAFAGPLSNFILATIGVVGLVTYANWTTDFNVQLKDLFQSFIFLNLALAFFNMVPIHPLDGSKVIARFLPEDLNRKLEENQQALSMVLLVILFAGGFQFLRIPIGWTYENLIRMAQYLVV